MRRVSDEAQGAPSAVVFMLMVCVLLLLTASATLVGLVFLQASDMSGHSFATGDSELRDPVTGLVCARCDPATGDIWVEAGTLFLGEPFAQLAPDGYEDACMQCGPDTSSGAGARVYDAVPLLQDDYVPVDGGGRSIYQYGVEMQSAAAPIADGGVAREGKRVDAATLEARSGRVLLERFASGQTCAGPTCGADYEPVSAANTTAVGGFPDPCAGGAAPPYSLYTLHRDMDGSVEFVGGATLASVAGGGSTFLHVCACVRLPTTGELEQRCTGPLVGAVGGDATTQGAPVV